MKQSRAVGAARLPHPGFNQPERVQALLAFSVASVGAARRRRARARQLSAGPACQTGSLGITASR
jgi:hypothetical protein